MANRRNSIKKIRSDEAKRQRNRMALSSLRTMARSFRETCQSKQADQAKSLINNYYSKLDKAVKHGILKKNTAARYKSSARKRLNACA